MLRYRVRRIGGIVARAVGTVAVAAAAGAVVLFLTGPNGSISCVSPASAAGPEPLPRWAIAAGIPALIAAIVGAYFALGAESMRTRLAALLMTAALAAGTFYAVYTLLPASCRP
jgi:hypothetical protein